MNYILSSKENTYALLHYIHETSENPSLFHEGISLAGLKPIIKYKAKSKTSLEKIRSLHFLSSTGPDLVSKRLKEVLEEVAPTEVEFFEATICFQNTELHDFYAINVTTKLNCCDMNKSEYEITNFDPNDPCYMFLYTVLLEEIPNNFNIVRCSERPTSIVVSETLKTKLKEGPFPGLIFCRAIDLTPKNRSQCE
ncbi:imm11 family protein [Pseudomonas plecoglossicida]|uniref:imm11 family protein n=1 Tax=Pseudomonas plecoglossicida TaxID=70775 RepID=UPI003977C5B6